MYRLSNYLELQKEVNQELINGFQFCFDIPADSKTIDWDNETIDSACGVFCETKFDIEAMDETARDLFLAKIKRMYEELFDTEYEYTYDEFGEWILSKIIADVRWKTEEFDIPWDTYLGASGKEGIKKQIACYTAFLNDHIETMEDIMEEDEELFKNVDYIMNAANENTLTLGQFPYMDGDMSPIFWDCDYALYDDFDFDTVEKLFKAHPEMGFVSSDDDREPISGSIRSKIADKEGDE